MLCKARRLNGGRNTSSRPEPASALRRPMIDYGTFAGLLEHDHGLAAYRPWCSRWSVLPPAKLVAHRNGPLCLTIRMRCRECGEVGRLQVRPPVLTSGPVGGWSHLRRVRAARLLLSSSQQPPEEPEARFRVVPDSLERGPHDRFQGIEEHLVKIEVGGVHARSLDLLRLAGAPKYCCVRPNSLGKANRCPWSIRARNVARLVIEGYMSAKTCRCAVAGTLTPQARAGGGVRVALPVRPSEPERLGATGCLTCRRVNKRRLGSWARHGKPVGPARSMRSQAAFFVRPWPSASAHLSPRLSVIALGTPRRPPRAPSAPGVLLPAV